VQRLRPRQNIKQLLLQQIHIAFQVKSLKAILGIFKPQQQIEIAGNLFKLQYQLK